MIKNNDTVSTKNYTIASFFGGVGGIDLGFEQTKKFSTVYINEFDKNAQETISINLPYVNLDKRDIHEVKSIEVPKTDVIVGGFPCQAFSIAGYRKGFEDDRGDLFFELLRIINHNRPRVIFIENVKNLVTHDHGNTFKIIREALTLNGYFIKWSVINGKDYGNIPQNRERIYIAGFIDKNAFNKFQFPDKIELTLGLNSVIDFKSKVEDKYYYREGIQPFYDKLKEAIISKDSVYQWRRQYVRENKSGVVPTLTANMGTGGHNVPLILSDHGIRKLTPRETFNVQGFPKDFKLPKISNAQLYKQAGNSVVVPVIKRIANNIAEALKYDLGKEEIYINKNDNKNILIYVNMKSRFEGESFIKAYVDNDNEAKQLALETEISIIEDEEYLKLVKKDVSKRFYSLYKSK
ncbi:DNA (cytosine-5-)-methyltransferase [uncultured Clostridium sp.]|uniref:DNA (cytosine-5-)-methyltransferase n=1 Tax=uncultured Clostridium sp. TaxID=59620 RepID=UPI002639DFAF|nr:DNA (cytosine-5-)-methyltransferase [uncultured Clostridium sp.]